MIIDLKNQSQNKYVFTKLYIQIHFFIQTEENNYNKVLGNKRINVQEWIDSK